MSEMFWSPHSYKMNNNSLKTEIICNDCWFNVFEQRLPPRTNAPEKCSKCGQSKPEMIICDDCWFAAFEESKDTSEKEARECTICMEKSTRWETFADKYTVAKKLMDMAEQKGIPRDQFGYLWYERFEALAKKNIINNVWNWKKVSY